MMTAGDSWEDPLAPPVVTETDLNNWQLTLLCAQKIMNWQKIEFGEVLWGVDEDHIEWEEDRDGALDFLESPILSDMLLNEMAKDFCVEVSSRTLSVDGELLKRWNAYFWEPALVAQFPQAGDMAVNLDRKRSIVLAALKAKKVIP